VFINPSLTEIQNIDFHIGDTVDFEVMYDGKDPVLYMSFDMSIEATLEKQSPNQELFWHKRVYPITNNEPFIVSFVVPDNWKDDIYGINDTKYFQIHVTTDFHLLDYKYALK
jgi:hypothetical protein